MLEIAAKLPPGALVGGEERLLAQALLRSGGARFVAREADLVRHEGRITAWREAKGAVEAVAAAPNIGNSRFEAGPPGALVCSKGINCGFVLPGFAPAVTAFTVALVYSSGGEARTLASVSTGQAQNVIFLSEAEGRNLDGSPRYPSRFLLDIDDSLLQFTHTPREDLIRQAREYIGFSTRHPASAPAAAAASRRRNLKTGCPRGSSRTSQGCTGNRAVRDPGGSCGAAVR